ncbi:putative diguanylate cyclase/phosphodiesterase with PAS/PAC domain [Pseudomonas sp. St29]|nr:putative diguanylate cyclase/phosphodiesterase with PAS/PAC domain [Pseudomonas sp. St29]
MYVGVFLLSVVIGLLEGYFFGRSMSPGSLCSEREERLQQNLCAVAKGEAINLLAQRLLM